jgi:hypothetical protein
MIEQNLVPQQGNGGGIYSDSDNSDIEFVSSNIQDN